MSPVGWVVLLAGAVLPSLPRVPGMPARLLDFPEHDLALCSADVHSSERCLVDRLIQTQMSALCGQQLGPKCEAHVTPLRPCTGCSAGSVGTPPLQGSC